MILSYCLITGCASQKTLYYWGNYEDLVYQMYVKPGSADPATQVAKLTEDIGKAKAEGRMVPPGVHAHLGYMHFLQGDALAAAQELNTEKTLFPESAKFVDGLLDRLKK
jgi:hypothetical protein